MINHTVPLCDLAPEILTELESRLGQVSYERYEAPPATLPASVERIALRHRKLLPETVTGKTLDPVSFEDIDVRNAQVEMVYRAVYVQEEDGINYILAVSWWKHVCVESDFDSLR